MNGWKRWHVILGVIATVLAIGVVVYGSARAGVDSAVREEINRQIESDNSPLNRQIQAEIHRHEVEICGPRWEEIRVRLRGIERQNAQLETKLDMLLRRVDP